MSAVLNTDEELFGEVLSFNAELAAGRRNAVRNARLVSAGFFVLAVGGLAAGYAGFSRQPEPPLVALVDASGTVTVLDAVPERTLTYGQALDESHLQQYVEQRERWKPGLAYDDYKAVALMSSPAVQREFLAQYQGEQSRQARFGEHVELRVTVRSIVAKDGTATVWYSTEEKRSGDIPAAIVKKMATVKYAYINAAMKPEDRRRNPLGFQVEEYLTYDEAGGAR